MENPLRYVKLLPLQGDKFASIITQGVALGYELLPFQGVLLIEAFSPCRPVQVKSSFIAAYYWSGFSTKPWYSGTSPDMIAS